MITLNEHLKTTHEFVEALRILYPEKKMTQQPKKEKGKDTKK